jgi:hypothetical protein
MEGCSGSMLTPSHTHLGETDTDTLGTQTLWSWSDGGARQGQSHAAGINWDDSGGTVATAAWHLID